MPAQQEWIAKVAFKGTNFYLGVHKTVVSACLAVDNKLVSLRLRERRPRVCFPALPEGGVDECARQLLLYKQHKKQVLAAKVDKYGAALEGIREARKLGQAKEAAQLASGVLA